MLDDKSQVTHGFPQNPSPLFISNKFPIENRSGIEYQDVQRVLKDLARLRAPEITGDQNYARKEPGLFHQLIEYLSDWHLVTFLPSTGLISEVKFSSPSVLTWPVLTRVQDARKLLVRAAASASSGDPKLFYEFFQTNSWETLMTFTKENACACSP